MPDGTPFHDEYRALLERGAARGCRVSGYMLRHDCWFPEAVEALTRALPPATVPAAADFDDDNPYPDGGPHAA